MYTGYSNDAVLYGQYLVHVYAGQCMQGKYVVYVVMNDKDSKRIGCVLLSLHNCLHMHVMNNCCNVCMDNPQNALHWRKIGVMISN